MARTPYGWQHDTWSSSSEGQGAVETPRPGPEKLGARVTGGCQEHAQSPVIAHYNIAGKGLRERPGPAIPCPPLLLRFGGTKRRAGEQEIGHDFKRCHAIQPPLCDFICNRGTAYRAVTEAM
eukprot:scaffold61115_cov62-Phaeocystis_antarctica.AAC.2